jgi:hypothetical protein
MYYDRAYQFGVVVFRNVAGGKQNPDRLAVDILSRLAAARRTDLQAEIDRRLKEQKPNPASESDIRGLIEELKAGKPRYDRMSSSLARQTRRQLGDQQKTLVGLGALQSLTFKAVGPAGPDIYVSKFEKGALEWRIWHNLDGGIDFFNYRPVPPTK